MIMCVCIFMCFIKVRDEFIMVSKCDGLIENEGFNWNDVIVIWWFCYLFLFFFCFIYILERYIYLLDLICYNDYIFIR